MAFWSEAAEEPLRQYRWYMNFGATTNSSAKIDGLVYALKKVDKPKAKVNEITHKYLNHFFYYPGRLEWEAINLTIASVKMADTALYNVLTTAGYKWPTGPEIRNTISKNAFGSAIGSKLSLIQVDAAGTPIETWELKNPFFTSVQFGALDYGSEEIVEITCTLRYDMANLIASGATEANKDGAPTPPPTPGDSAATNTGAQTLPGTQPPDSRRPGGGGLPPAQ